MSAPVAATPRQSLAAVESSDRKQSSMNPRFFIFYTSFMNPRDSDRGSRRVGAVPCCDYHFPIDLARIRILIGAKSIGKE